MSEPLYCAPLMTSGPTEIERKPHVNGQFYTVLIDIGAWGHSFDDLIIPELTHRLREYTSLGTPRTILTAGGALLDGTAEVLVQSFITDHYG